MRTGSATSSSRAEWARARSLLSESLSWSSLYSLSSRSSENSVAASLGEPPVRGAAAAAAAAGAARLGVASGMSSPERRLSHSSASGTAGGASCPRGNSRKRLVPWPPGAAPARGWWTPTTGAAASGRFRFLDRRSHGPLGHASAVKCDENRAWRFPVPSQPGVGHGGGGGGSGCDGRLPRAPARLPLFAAGAKKELPGAVFRLAERDAPMGAAAVATPRATALAATLRPTACAFAVSRSSNACYGKSAAL